MPILVLLHQVSLKKMPAKLAKRGFLGFSSKKRFSRCHRMTTELLQHLKGRKFFPCGPRTIFSSLFWIQKVAEACNFTKSNSPPWVFFTFFLNYTNGTKSRKASHRDAILEYVLLAHFRLMSLSVSP